MPKKEKGFDPIPVLKWDSFGGPNASGSRTLHLPKIKYRGRRGETVVVTRQTELLDPILALHNHATVNKSDIKDSIAVYSSRAGDYVAMTTRKLLKRINNILDQSCFLKISSHCFCIGGTTNLLLMGVPPDVIKIMGH